MDGRRCPACGASNSTRADWCSQCFAPFEVQSPHAAAPASPLRTWSCSTCSRDNPVTTDHCLACHAPITTTLGAAESGSLVGFGTAVAQHGDGASAGGPYTGQASATTRVARTLGAPMSGLGGPRRRRSLGNRLRVGLRLVGVGFRIAWEDPRLLAAPFLSGLATLAVVGIVWLVSGIGPVELAEADALGFEEWLVIGVVTYFAAIFAVLAESFVVAAATLHFDRLDARAGRVWAIVTPRLGALLRWAFIKATVTLVFQWLRQKLQQGQARRTGAGFALSAAETAWATLTVLVVPVILYEDEDPRRAIRQSMALFRRTWGQTLVGGFGLGIALTALTFVAILVSAPLVMLNVGFGLAIALLLLVLVQCIGSVAAGALVAALYRYATTGELPGGYRPEDAAVAVTHGPHG